MEFHEKLQQLRKQKGLTQEELAAALFVSRTAVSKWESGKGYPNIDSLKAVAKLFSVTVDELLDGEQLLTIAAQKESHLCDLTFGLLDICVAAFFFLPFFGQESNAVIQEVSLLSLTAVSVWLKTAYFVAVVGIVVFGILTLALQNVRRDFWIKYKHPLSLILNALGALLFIVSSQPYAAAFLFIFFILKALLLMKRR